MMGVDGHSVYEEPLAYAAARGASIPVQGVLTTKQESGMQQTLLNVKRKFGRNAVMKAMDLEEGATALQRNRQIGGHLA